MAAPHNRTSSEVLELVVNGDCPQFQASMVHHPLDLTAGPHNRTPLHIAALQGQVQIVECIMSSPNISVGIVNAKDSFGYRPLHLAVRAKHESIVQILTTSSLTDIFAAATSEEDELGEECDGFTPLHLAAVVGNPTIVKEFIQQYKSSQVSIHATTWQGTTALDIAKQRNHTKVVELLECCDVKWLQLERQKSANSVNAILVGAVLIATVAFGCILQPPLGVPSSSWDPEPSMAPTSQKEFNDLAQVRYEQTLVAWFLVLISISFAFSVVSLVIGTASMIPSRGAGLKREVKQLRGAVLKASVFLFLAIFFNMLSFQLGCLIVFLRTSPFKINIVFYVGRIVLLGLPIISLAYIFRYVVLPKGVFSCKKWVLALFFTLAIALMSGLVLAITSMINIDASLNIET